MANNKITKKERTQIIALFFGLIAYGILTDPINQIINTVLPGTVSKLIGGIIFVVLFFWILKQ